MPLRVGSGRVKGAFGQRPELLLLGQGAHVQMRGQARASLLA